MHLVVNPYGDVVGSLSINTVTNINEPLQSIGIMLSYPICVQMITTNPTAAHKIFSHLITLNTIKITAKIKINAMQVVPIAPGVFPSINSFNAMFALLPLSIEFSAVSPLYKSNENPETITPTIDLARADGLNMLFPSPPNNIY